MFLGLPSKLPRIDPAGAFSIAVMTLLLAALVVQAGMAFDLFWPAATYSSFLVQLVITIGYLVWVFGRFKIAVVAAGFVVILYLVLQHLVFVRNAGAPVNLNAVVSYAPLLSFVPFCRSRVPITTTLRIFVGLIFLYCCFYVFAHQWILQAGFGEHRSILDGDADRGVRLYFAGVFASFAAFYALFARRMFMPIRVLIFGMAVAGIVFSGSRTFQALFVLILVLTLTGLLTYWVRIALYGAFLAVCLTILAGVVIPGWNPFGYFASDGSGFARSLEFYHAVQAVRSHWLLGVGIPGSFGAFQEYLETPMYEPLYVTDLGVMGPLVIFGLPGLILFLVATWFVMVTPIRGLDTPSLRALRVNCVLAGLMGVITPSLLMEQNAVFLMLLIAARVRRAGMAPLPAKRRSNRAVRLPAGIHRRLMARFSPPGAEG